MKSAKENSYPDSVWGTMLVAQAYEAMEQGRIGLARKLICQALVVLPNCVDTQKRAAVEFTTFNKGMG